MLEFCVADVATGVIAPAHSADGPIDKAEAC